MSPWREPLYPYGRSPAAAVLADCRLLALITERLTTFGPIPAGVTVYRDNSGLAPQWYKLPDPARVIS